jgi:hypothetical protein
MICVRLGIRKEGQYMQSAHIYIKKRKYFVPNALSKSNSRCTTVDFRILIQIHTGLSYKG